MDTIQVTARLTIHEGKLEEFKELAAQCMRAVRERDSGTLQYDWFFNNTHTECVVRETYKDSGAVLEHIANLGPTMGALLGVSDMALEIYGSPSAELVKAAAGLAPRIYSPFQSI
jgi:quinol monooxygenase YgiN